jgi:C1A family cysteine protease
MFNSTRKLQGESMKKEFRAILSILAVILVPCLFLTTFIYGAQDEHNSINSMIKQKGGDWEAGETSMTRLDPEARKNRVGLRKPVLSPEEDKAVEEEQKLLAAIPAPASFDWRLATGTYVGNFVTPIRNQGNCGSCWAFATTAALESQVLMGNNSPGIDLNLSEQILVSCSGAGNCGGGYIDKAANYVRDMGLPVETCLSYTATNNSCANACSGWTNNSYHIDGWHWVATTSPTVDSLKNALITYGPLVTTMDVYADFYSYKSGVYSYVSGTYQGGHGIVLVGYNDAGQYFIAKNSWGTGWGEAGYFRIAYSQLSSVVEFGQYTIANEGYEGGTPPPPPPTCTYSISPTNKSFTYSGGTGTIVVSTQSNCAWTAASKVSWITITSGYTGTGNGSVNYQVMANTTNYQRTGTLTIAGKTFTVTQSRRRR